ncbi:MAG: DNA-deoxyinosine glycosylase [Clostridia bacterium]|nr:DNA-deoxyinosine glycosylase [Clostridia bacterium]
MQERHVKHNFPPVIDKDCEVLILGSVPSVKSVEANFYYGHPQNRFWKILSALFGEDFVLLDDENMIQKRKELLLSHHVALYDSVEECDILGSSDAHIKNVVPSDIASLIEGTKISKIFCNGNTSYKYFVEYNKNLTAQPLPSTSPANAGWSLEKLVEKWRVVLAH